MSDSIHTLPITDEKPSEYELQVVNNVFATPSGKAFLSDIRHTIILTALVGVLLLPQVDIAIRGAISFTRDSPMKLIAMKMAIFAIVYLVYTNL